MIQQCLLCGQRGEGFCGCGARNEEDTRRYEVPVYRLSLVREGVTSVASDRCDDTRDALTVARAILGDRETEHMLVVFCNANNLVLGTHIVAIGQLTSVHVLLRDVFKAAIVANAHHVILAHNHPSGIAIPSREDMMFTMRAIEAGRFLGVDVVDHIIVTNGECYYSMSEEANA